VDKAVVLGALEYLIRLGLVDEAVGAKGSEVSGVVVEVHAHVVLKMAAAFAHQSAGPAAGAGTHGDGGSLLDKSGKLVIGCHAVVAVDGGFHRHDTHKGHARAQVRHKGRNAAAGGFLKAGAQIRVAVAMLTGGKDALHDSRDPDRIVVVWGAALIAYADSAGDAQLVQLLLGEVQIFSGSLRHLGG